MKFPEIVHFILLIPLEIYVFFSQFLAFSDFHRNPQQVGYGFASGKA